MIDIPIVIGNTAAYARVESPAPIERLEYQVLDGRREPSPELACRLLDRRTFDSVEAQVARGLAE